MTISFGKSNDVVGLEDAIASGQAQGQLTPDDNWSDVQRAAFAAVAGSCGFTDTDKDGTYVYDGTTKAELTPEVLEAAMTKAANDVVVEQAVEAQSGADDVQELSDTVDQAVVAKDVNDQLPLFDDPTGMVSPIIGDAKDKVGKELESAINAAPAAAQSGVDAVSASAQETHETAESVEAAGYGLTEETHASVDGADQAIKEAQGAQSEISATVEVGLNKSKNIGSVMTESLFKLQVSSLQLLSEQLNELKKITGEAQKTP